MRNGEGDSGGRFLGVDVGSATVKAAVVVRGRVRALWNSSRGRPREVLAGLLRRLLEGERGPVRVAVTGGGALLLAGLPGVLRANGIVAAARGARAVHPAARTVLDLGGQSSRFILLEPGPAGAVADFATNGLCAAGSGAFLEQQADRLRMNVDRLGRIAEKARRGASIAGRCSVFAKSDMIHLQQKGTPVDELAYGLCLALARTFAATVADGRRILPPVMLVGGGAANPGLVRAFRDVLNLDGDDLVVPDEPLAVTALGAARLAASAEPLETEDLLAALERHEETSGGRERDASTLPPLFSVERDQPRCPVEDPEPAPGPVEGFLGVDVGSVSTNLVVLDRDGGLLQSVYLPTRGRPVEVLDEGLRRIRERYGDRLRILGVGTTGSGRHLAAALLGADTVRNEITAQMASTVRWFPDVDTIFEIGGQDSKFISVREGRLAGFEMNKICAAGTGSFLEEQAGRLGIAIREEFASLALRARKPCDLGTRCTVFMDTELARARERGESPEDLCAGLAYSVARNYLEKLVNGHPVGNRVVFQGGTASNEAVVAAFRRLLGRPVHVHPYHRVSGAIGAAILASREREARGYVTSFRGFDACSGAEMNAFECRSCENLCRVNRVRAGGRVVHFGDVCERYSERDRHRAAPERPFPELFEKRERLLEEAVERHAASAGDGEPIGLLRTSLNLEFLPMWAALLSRLGFRPVVASRCTPRTLDAHGGSVPAEVCLPIKAAAAQARALLASGRVERVFLPSVQECPPRDRREEAHTCLYNQGLPDMLRGVLGERLVTAQFAIRDGVVGLVEPSLALARALRSPVDRVARALAHAREAQEEFGRSRRRVGREALNARFERAVVVLGKPYNTHDPFTNLRLARLLDRVGLPAIPWDLLSLEGIGLEERWRSVPWHFNREQLRAVQLLRDDRRLFPLLVSSYGCGPDAFLFKHMEELLSDRPRLMLEFDEHRGEAGLVTRLEAFADEIEAHLSASRRAARGRRTTPASSPLPRGRRFHVPHFSEHARIYAGLIRSAGYDAEVLPPVDAETLRLGEEAASGRECHPYAVLAGEFRRFAERARSRPRGDEVFLAPSCATPCLLRQYGDGFRILAKRLDLPIEIWDAASGDLRRIVGVAGIARLYEGLLATDILVTLAWRLRPYVRDPAEMDRAVTRGTVRFESAMAARRTLDPDLAAAARELWAQPRNGEPGLLPVVGITGDLYTRINPVGNAGLFRRLQGLGCEVWPSPSFAAMTELGALVNSRQHLERGRLGQALGEGLTRGVTSAIRRRLHRSLPEPLRRLAVEPDASEFVELARPFVGPGTNYLVLHSVGKIVHFLRAGAAGVINAAALNCMVGTAIAATVPGIRAACGNAPVVTLVYGASEGPAQRLRIETFAHQVIERHRTAASA